MSEQRRKTYSSGQDTVNKETREMLQEKVD